jgi:hypothetical protein
MSYASPWETSPGKSPAQALPPELLALDERIRSLPAPVRAELEPIIADALEQARFRGRVLTVAREAIERLRLDLACVQFDLHATRREHEQLRRKLGA